VWDLRTRKPLGVIGRFVFLVSIVLEPAYIRWQKLDGPGVRVSRFLTTYGIWNADSRTWVLVAAEQVIGL
jgi:hypothetical protein